MEFDPNHKIGLAGEYNAGVTDCPECDSSPKPLHAYALGIADAPIGRVIVIQCPECFTKWYFHCRDNEKLKTHYDYFVEMLQLDMNHWLNPDGSERI